MNNRLLFISFLLLLGCLLPFSAYPENILKGGAMDDSQYWSTARLGAAVPVNLTWNYTEVTPSGGEGGALRLQADHQSGAGSNIGLYQAIRVKKDHLYEFDGLFRVVSNTNQMWAQVFIISEEPNDDGEYASMGETLTMGQLNTWSDASITTFDGAFSEKARAGSAHTDGLLRYLHTGEDTQLYFLLKIGTSDHALDVVIDNLVLNESASRPSAGFTSITNKGFAPLTVAFTNTSRSADSYVWNFGDGNTSTEENAVHTYANEGKYTVSLKAINLYGEDTMEKTDFVSVNVKTPQPAGEKLYGGHMEDEGYWYTAALGAAVPVELTWNYTDHIPAGGEGGGLRLQAGTVSGQGSNVAIFQAVEVKKDHVYAFDCLFKVLSSTDNLWVQPFMISERPKEEGEEGTMEENATMGQLNSWTDSSVNTYDGPMSAKAVAGSLHLSNGNELLTYHHTGEDATLYFVLKIGTYDHVMDIVIDNLSLTESVYVPKPKANFLADVTGGDAPLTVNFTNFSENATSWLWNFGDGNTSTVENPQYTYAANGTYTVSLTATGTETSNTVTIKDFITVGSEGTDNSISPDYSNIASGKSVIVSGYSGSNMGKFINDDKTTTQWRVNDGGDEHWAQIDLKDPYDLNRIRIQWGEGVPVSYTLSASKNATDWQEVKTLAPSGTGQADVVMVNDVKEVRYLRIHLSGDENGSGFSVYEWEVFGEESDVEQVATLSVSPAEEYLVTGMEELRILSLNNSLIDYNEQPDIFNQLAAAAGKNATWEKQTRLGMTLRYHYEEGEGMISDGNPSAKYRIRSTPWTHIILQEQSTKPRTDVTDFLASVKLWVDYVKEYCPNPDARIILHLNWPYTDSEDFDGHMEELYENYKAVAEETGVSIYAVGRAFHIIYETDGVSAKNALYTDNRHPTVLASYLSACTIYEGIFGESPEGIDYYPSGISKDDAQRMQTRAHQAAWTHRNVCDYNGTIPFAYRITDQFNRPMEEAGEEVTWNVNGGGTIGQDGLFESNGQTGTYTVSASYKEQTATATVEVIKFSQLEDEYVEITASRKYEQDFDSMGTEAEAELPLGWKVEKMTGANAQRTIGMFSAAGNKTEYAGGVSLASNATNGLYNFGNGNDTDRAIGGITTGDTEKTQGINVYVHLKNTGEEVIPGLEISYDVEKYRKGNNPAGFTMQLYCSPDGITWTSAGENFTTSFEADDATEGYAVVPGDVRSVSAYLPLSMAAGEELYLAWNTSVTSGTTSSGAQALALDNVVIAAGEPSETDYVEINEETYLQDFDAIGTDAEATLPLGWKIEKRLDSPRTIGIFALSGNQTEQVGGVNIASNAKNGLYNFGAGDADTAEDRAIGGISTGVADGTRSVNMYFKFKNTSDRKVESLDIEYDVEKYRNGNNVEGFRIQLYYSGNGKDWTNAGDNFRTYFAPDADMNGLASVPSVTRNVSGTLPVELEENQDLYLAWNYSVNAGTTASGAMALGIDNVKVKTNKMPLGISSASPDNIRVYINGERRLIIDGPEEFTATVYQVNGQQVCSVTTSETVMPEVSGVYLVKVRCHKTGQIKIAKVIM